MLRTDFELEEVFRVNQATEGHAVCNLDLNDMEYKCTVYLPKYYCSLINYLIFLCK